MLLSITKNEIIYSLYISSFEQIKKYLDKKDNNFQTIQKCCDNLNQSKNILTEDNNLEKDLETPNYIIYSTSTEKGECLITQCTNSFANLW